MSDIPEGRGRGSRLQLDKLREIEALFAVHDPTVKKWPNHVIVSRAKALGVHKATFERYVDAPGKLEKAIAKAEQERDWRYFVEGMRLLSTPVPDLIESLRADYIPNLTSIPLSKKLAKKSQKRDVTEALDDKNDKRPKKESLPLGSVGSCYNVALECFDTESEGRTVRARRADEALNAKVKTNLLDWPRGTVGVHTITITWDYDHGKSNIKRDDYYSKTGGRMDVMVLAERKRREKVNVAFSPILPTTTDEEKAEDIRSFLDDIESPVKTVRLVTKKDGTGSSPTAMDRETLQRLLGDTVKVEEDVPTQSYRGSLSPRGRTATAFKVKGRFKSEVELFLFLQRLLCDGYRALNSLPPAVG